jgi:hypothetical protein
MATLFHQSRLELRNRTIDYIADSIVLALFTGSYTPDLSHQTLSQVLSAGLTEVALSGYSRQTVGGKSIVNEVFSGINYTRYKCTSPVSFGSIASSATPITAMLAMKDVGGGVFRVIAHHNITPTTPNGQPFAVTIGGGNSVLLEDRSVVAGDAGMFNQSRLEILNRTINYLTDTIEIALFTGSYTFDQADLTISDLTSAGLTEVALAGYSRQQPASRTIATEVEDAETWTTFNGTTPIQFGSIASSATPITKWAMIRNTGAGASNRVIAIGNINATAPNGQPFDVTFANNTFLRWKSI